MNDKQFVSQAESLPCACGRRQSAEPQYLVSEVKCNQDTFGTDVQINRYSAHLVCGICNKRHKMVCVEAINES